MNPDAGLPLAEANEEALGLLRRIHAEVEQGENQFIGQGGQNSGAPTARARWRAVWRCASAASWADSYARSKVGSNCAKGVSERPVGL